MVVNCNSRVLPAITMELIEHLKENLSISRHQAAGGAGLLLELAQEKLPADEFLRVADSIPAISDIIAKAPRHRGRGISRWRATLSRWLGGLGELTPLVQPFSMLGLDKSMLRNCSCEMLDFFRVKGGESIHALLLSVWR